MKNRRKSSRRENLRSDYQDNDENQEENCDEDSLDGTSSTLLTLTSKIPIRNTNDRHFEKISLPIPRKLYSEHFLLEQTFDDNSFHENLLKIKTLSNDFGNAIQIKREVCGMSCFELLLIILLLSNHHGHRSCASTKDSSSINSLTTLSNSMLRLKN
jgi:hypothetical protein